MEVAMPLERLSLSVSSSVLKSVYYALFESQLQYGTTVLLWGNSGGAARVLKLQKAAVRILGQRAPRTPCRPLFARLGLRTLPDLLAEALVVRVRLNEGNFARQSEVHDHDTRHSGDLVTSRHRLALTQKRSPDYLGVRLFNHLPKDVRALPLRRFKVVVKAWLVVLTPYSLDEVFRNPFP
ncbi:hypothetical protein GE061_013316 [Apolygus lucorum]|uniref:Uncharacterized protein n=1 Tax=Apolygus lucorum TaxID=248454 RepID=A0A8S9XMP0_APOLU|nr:hypothetical protein GE061_013316 [Apolygus lucorum]